MSNILVPKLLLYLKYMLHILDYNGIIFDKSTKQKLSKGISLYEVYLQCISYCNATMYVIIKTIE